jgi:hypothetical protein
MLHLDVLQGLYILNIVLQIFKSVSVIFSSDTPSLPSVIPAMDMIDRMLDGAASDDTLNESIRAALSLGHNLLYKYYKLTDLSDVYRIAMSMSPCAISYPLLIALLVLHPGHKTRYFKKAGMDDAWISKAIEMVHEEFERAYADYSQPESNNEHGNSSPRTNRSSAYDSDGSNGFLKFNLDSDSDSDDASSGPHALQDELTRYLSSDRVKDVKDPLKWWHENQHVYPKLYRMARDYLLIPGMYSLFICTRTSTYRC